MPGRARHALSAAVEGDGYGILFRLNPNQVGFRDQFDSFVTKRRFDNFRKVVGQGSQDMRAPLDQRHTTSDSPEELSEFAPDGAASEDENGFWYKIEVQHIVARPNRCLIEPWNRRTIHFGSGRDHDLSSAKATPVDELDFICIGKMAKTSVEVERPGFETASPVVSEISDDFPFSFGDGGHVGFRIGDVEAELPPALGEMQDFGGVEQCFGRHAAPEDAEAAEFFRPIDNRDTLTCVGGCSRGSVAGAAAADYEKVVFHFHTMKTMRARRKIKKTGSSPGSDRSRMLNLSAAISLLFYSGDGCDPL